MNKKQKPHYVDNKKFLQAMKDYKQLCIEMEETDDKPPISNYIGSCFLKIAQGLSYRPNFINYTFILTLRVYFLKLDNIVKKQTVA